jgi:carboxypeptidase PM20D1
MFNAGMKDNVLPATARAVVNFRILPGDTIDTVVEHVRRTIGDPSIEIRVLDAATEPSPVSDPEAAAFTQVARAIRATFPGTIVGPFLSLGATDARWYTRISPNVYRFAPYRLRAEDVSRIHGTNERIAIADYEGMIRFYIVLLRAV